METKLDPVLINDIRMKFMFRVNGEQHIREYLKAVEELSADDKVLLEEKLRRLITPLLSMVHDDSP